MVILLVYVCHLSLVQLRFAPYSPHAVAVQNNLKTRAALPVLVEIGSPLAFGKIPIVDFNDPVYRKELIQLARSTAFWLWFRRDKDGPTLTREQCARIGVVAAQVQLSRTLYEATIANFDDSNPAVVKISIPPYDASSLNDFLADQTTKITNDAALAQSMFGDVSHDRGAYPQNIEMTQKTVTGNSGEPVAIVSLLDHTMVTVPILGFAVPCGNSSSFPKNQPDEYAPFVAFLK